MIAPARVAAILLAAGRGTRFGSDKLLWPVGGCALGMHAAHALAALPFHVRIAVTAPRGIRYDKSDFISVVNHHAAQGLASSIRLGVAKARQYGVNAVLIALADMPLVPPSHFSALLSCYHDEASIIASETGHASPPALFGRGWFDRLEALKGDHGAKLWLAEAKTVCCETRWLLDIDAHADLKHIQ